MSRTARLITCRAQSLRCLLSVATLSPFCRCAASFLSLRCLLSVAALPPFCCYEGSDPLLPSSLRSVAHWVRPLSLPVATLPPFCRCAASFLSLRGVRPPVASLASLGGTLGLTPGASWRLLSTPGASWRLLSTPGACCRSTSPSTAAAGLMKDKFGDYFIEKASHLRH